MHASAASPLDELTTSSARKLFGYHPNTRLSPTRLSRSRPVKFNTCLLPADLRMLVGLTDCATFASPSRAAEKAWSGVVLIDVGIDIVQHIVILTSNHHVFRTAHDVHGLVAIQSLQPGPPHRNLQHRLLPRILHQMALIMQSRRE